jgi:hypothetical protein
MRSKVKLTSPEMALTRILEAFGQELIDASDEEIGEVAKELGMDLQMKGSGAFAGLTFPAKWQMGDFFDVEAINRRIARGTADRSTRTALGCRDQGTAGGAIADFDGQKERREIREAVPASQALMIGWE